MKELSGWEVIKEILKDKESCSIYEINVWADAYRKKHPYTYLNITRDDLSCISPKSLFWNYKDERFYKQSTVNCPICDEIVYKYPNTKKYYKTLKAAKLFKIKDRINEE